MQNPGELEQHFRHQVKVILFSALDRMGLALFGHCVRLLSWITRAPWRRVI
jgi:hypothetical protein